ncbi:DDE transposase family protein [Solitalea koreensis]|uniref:DDE transposase family protein n=1 Tax=Solitalea koreensis TaxID=543615 RepID=A0A521BM60_9SPHI|nr:DDE transposase family protein [Solitalea koreensis]SMO48185.1 hypothetical protein SAMN06265350_102329 [Solitalea koreensis]
MAAQPLSNKQKKEWAKLLFVRENVTVQKELALRVGVSEKTIGKWIEEENWKRLRASNVISKDEQLSRLYMQLTELNDHIFQKPEGFRFADSKQADTIVKLTAAIKQLETDCSVAEAMEVGRRYLQFIRVVDFDSLKTSASLYDAFIKKLINESRR